MGLYRQRLKQKTLLLVVLFGFLIFLIMPGTRKESEQDLPEEGERLEIPKEEEEEGTVFVPEEVWEMPGADATIRVLILAEDGGIYHEGKELMRDYPGELQYYEEEQGWVIVNEVPLEEYLCRVVPSEMPSTYAKEALKAQAVCARTYAVWQMREYAYPQYEAHVNDSVSYQVYNQIGIQETTSQAVEETAGQIMLYEDGPVKAYYFSTSCGSTTDENIWEKGDRELTPYIAGRRVGELGSGRDLTDEDTFSEFIRKKHAGDLEISEPWYRWSCYIPLEQIQKNVEKWAKIRAERSQDGILLEDGTEYVLEDVDTIGAVESAQIITRNTGGVVQELLLTGEKGTLKVRYEYNIRLMLGIPDGEIHKNDGTASNGGNLLPSGYFVMEPVQEDKAVTGYQIYGGGLGHGAGMSQNGARVLAEEGYGYDGILQYFYHEIRLARLE
ncbi:MAG: SpoIID/LytB domain-containing protein [Lachnospiraceae bacterium]|nr:SpoIID/LytB domain-containing protein [Lachnospiraceae bacterium]